VVIGSDITVTVLESRGDRVRLGIAAPAHVSILRGELTTRADGPAPDTGPEGEADRSRSAAARADR
jgi:carbon storage regulator